MVRPQALDRGCEAYARRQWRVAYEQLSAAAGEGELGLDDLERLATAAYLIGNDEEAIATWKRLHQAHVECGNVERAVRFGFWLGLGLLLRGEAGQSAGWIARSQRLLEDRPVDCVEHGYVLVVPGLRAMGGGDARGACATFERVVALGSRHGDPDLLAVGLLSRGQALIQGGESDAGVASLDEALVGVTSGEVSPILAGILYCAAILTCQRVFDLRRAKEWTAALSDWCTAQPELVPFRGECLVHRAEIMHLQGEWDQALREAEHACAQLVDGLRIKGRALYVMGEIHRLRGDLERAEALYADAGGHGYEPQPGVSRLRVAQGQIDAASATMRRVLTESGNLQGPRAGTSRPGVLAPFVEIMLAVDPEAARAAAEELTGLASERDVPALRAAAAAATGAVQLAAGNASAALADLREAWMAWQQLDAPYEAARVRVSIGEACRRLGDLDTARLHFVAARAVFERLGAAPDVARLDRIAGDSCADGSPLTDREVEVLVLVAEGRTNRQIAAVLAISEHTVARHLSNIFHKLGVGSRTAASAYAFARGLMGGHGSI